MSALWEADELAAGFGADGPGFAITGISIDTRTLQPGDLFVALSGERDGHDFVSEALAKGAAGALVSRPQPRQNRRGHGQRRQNHRQGDAAHRAFHLWPRSCR